MGRSEEVRRRLDQDLPRLAGVHDVPGVSAAVLVDGQVVEATSGVVNLRTGVRVTPDALFMIQSITKVWTATLVMQLVDDGLVVLDVPVQAYLPGFRTADTQSSAQITVRHLLTHTGGFEGDIWAPTTCGDDALERFVEDLVSQAPQHSRPGELYSYCSAGYGVLGRLVEVSREVPYDRALRHYLANPLGIEEIAFCADEALAFRTAIGHVRPSTGAAQRPVKRWAVMPASNPAAGNQLAMSARALLAFGRMHVNDGRSVDGTRVLSVNGARAMWEWQVDHRAVTGAPTGHGLGWMLAEGLVGHGGDTIGVTATLQLVPDRRMAVAMLANGGAAGRLFNDLLESLLADLAGMVSAPPTPPADAGARISEPWRYVGRYQTRPDHHEVTFDDDGVLRLTTSAQNETLAMAAAAGITAEPERHELRRVAGDTFVMTDHSGATAGAVEFIGDDGTGRAQFLHTGRAAPRVD
ncbi:serine hydrolase domain-containing protein [Leekyejoonella antrihumi]|uniref:Beta-lactamase family protein n=1 Tax=Leekyejoonella antrihumi TaxID=1660198 RepID=A0A563E730_9MICO|nr:serine hydrolase domain-containing protein [Leekyejoonella antrihumi]TWP38330.1 beta-lactamase family protein [Leekyejoonella antrihumi]